jgi:hypothetical protein
MARCLGVGAVIGRDQDGQLVEPPCGASAGRPGRRSAIRQQNAHLRRAFDRSELHRCGVECQRQVGDTVPSQHEQVADHLLGRAIRTLGAEHEGLPRHRQHRRIGRAAEHDRRRDDGGGGQAGAQHRTGPIDHQAQGDARALPGRHGQLVGRRRQAQRPLLRRPPSRRQVEFAVGLRRPSPVRRPPAPGRGPARPRHLGGDAPGQACRQRSQ